MNNEYIKLLTRLMIEHGIVIPPGYSTNTVAIYISMQFFGMTAENFNKEVVQNAIDEGFANDEDGEDEYIDDDDGEYSEYDYLDDDEFDDDEFGDDELGDTTLSDDTLNFLSSVV